MPSASSPAGLASARISGYGPGVIDQAAPPPLGPLLHKHRKARRLTLDQLARKSGVSKSMLSQIERGEANPTFAILWNITRALGVDFADLVDLRSTSANRIEVLEPHFTPEIRTRDGLCVLRILNPVHSAGATEWYDLTIQPSGALSSEPHSAGTREHLSVLEGELVVESEGNETILQPGMTARYAADVPHRIANRGKGAARALLVVVVSR